MLNLMNLITMFLLWFLFRKWFFFQWVYSSRRGRSLTVKDVSFKICDQFLFFTLLQFYAFKSVRANLADCEMKQVLFLVFTALLLNFSICTHCYETCKFVASYFKRILNFPYILGMILSHLKLFSTPVASMFAIHVCFVVAFTHVKYACFGLRLHLLFSASVLFCYLTVVFVPTNLYAYSHVL